MHVFVFIEIYNAIYTSWSWLTVPATLCEKILQVQGYYDEPYFGHKHTKTRIWHIPVQLASPCQWLWPWQTICGGCITSGPLIFPLGGTLWLLASAAREVYRAPVSSQRPPHHEDNLGLASYSFTSIINRQWEAKQTSAPQEIKALNIPGFIGKCSFLSLRSLRTLSSSNRMHESVEKGTSCLHAR